MGMYAHMDDQEIKYSWPLSEAIRNAIGSDRLTPMVEDYAVVLTKGDVECLIVEINRIQMEGIGNDPISDPGTISEQFSLKVGWLGFGVLPFLMRWHRNADNNSTLVFA